MVTQLHYLKMPELKKQFVRLSIYDICSILWQLGEYEMDLNGELGENVRFANRRVKAKIERMCKRFGVPEEAYTDWFKSRWGCEQ